MWPFRFPYLEEQVPTVDASYDRVHVGIAFVLHNQLYSLIALMFLNYELVSLSREKYAKN